MHPDANFIDNIYWASICQKLFGFCTFGIHVIILNLFGSVKQVLTKDKYLKITKMCLCIVIRATRFVCLMYCTLTTLDFYKVSF